MSRKAGQLISRGSRTWLVRISLGRDPKTRIREYQQFAGVSRAGFYRLHFGLSLGDNSTYRILAELGLYLNRIVKNR
jgi:hypothetical protein